MLRILALLLLILSEIIYCQTFVLSQEQPKLIIDDIETYLSDYRKRVIEDNKLETSVAFGLALDLGWKRNGSLRGFVAFSFLQNLTEGDWKILAGGISELEIFRGGLGSSFFNNEKFKLNIELRNSLMILSGMEKGYQVTGKPAFVTVISERGVLHDPLDYSFSLGTTFINGLNHKRNQQLGTFSASSPYIQIQYYNDDIPFGWLALADRYDRYWTGGGLIGFYWKNNNSYITDFVLRYDNYTGYQRNLFEVSQLLNIDNLPYLEKEQQMFNQARFQYKVGIKNFFHFNFSIYEPLYSDFQNLIHYNISKNPFHARPLEKRTAIGFDYQYLYKK